MRLPAKTVAAAGAALALAVGLGGPQALAAPPGPGSPSAGDRLFPGLGNGGYDALHYDLGLDYDPATKLVSATAGIDAKATQSLSRFNLDFDGNDISRLTVNGRIADYRRDGAELVITPSRPLRGKFRVDVTYVADPRAEHDCVPIPPLTGSAWLPTDDGFGLAGQPNCMQSAYPNNDIPSDKATYTIKVTTPDDLTSVANGTLASTTHNQGRVVRTFRSTDPIATELVQVAVGDFAVFEHEAADGTPLRDVVPKDLLAASKPKLKKQSQHLTWLNRQIGVDYPLQNYGSLGLEADFGFALETQTVSLYPADIFTIDEPWVETIMVHELAHQWFGDYVAPATWSDLWLNEGHATWYELRYGQKLGEGTLEDAMKAQYAQGDTYRKAYGPVAKPTDDTTLFSDNVYGGGALVLYALRQEVGDKTFRAIEKRWVKKNANGVAGTDDFVALASQVARRDLRGFLESWVYGTTTPPMPGHPDWTVDPPSDEKVAKAKANRQHRHAHLG